MGYAQHLQAILLLPGTVTLLIPAILHYGIGRISSEHVNLPYQSSVFALFGGLLIGLGLLLVISTIIQFAHFGQGTLAPWAPPRRLVVQGIYRHVRNPMISGVFCILLGESAIMSSLPILGWFSLFFIAKLMYIPLREERELSRRFGIEYRLYKQHVPRWIPRMTPWLPPFFEPSVPTVRPRPAEGSRQHMAPVIW